MSQLKRYTSFEALKLNEKVDGVNHPEDNVFSKFEALLKQLQSTYSNKKKIKTDNGEQPDQ
ncbi:MAG: hypothetical protein WA958_06740 [Tunicatimonas sp.]